MQETEIEEFRKKLIHLGSELRGLEETSKKNTKPVGLDQASVGRLSRMDAMQGQQIALETSRRRREELVRIEGALRRIESGEYGVCVSCGEDIDVRRLVIAPASTCCVACADN